MAQNESKFLIRIKAYSKRELADLYEISMKSLKTWLDSIEEQLGPRVGRFIVQGKSK